MAKKRKWNISRAASFQSQVERRNRGRKRESLMVPISCLVLRGGLAVAVAGLASSLSGTIAVAQQIAVNVEGQAAQEASPDEEQPDDAYARQIVPFHTSEAPGTIIIPAPLWPCGRGAAQLHPSRPRIGFRGGRCARIAGA